MSNDRLAALTDMAAPLAASLGLELWGVELAGSSRPMVRLYVERSATAKTAEPGAQDGAEGEVFEDGTGVSVDQCAHLSRLLGLTLDVEDPFAAAWTLEVSSPGLERQFFRLDQLLPYVGREVELSLLDGHPDWPATGGAAPRKRFRGTIAAVGEHTFTLGVPQDARVPDAPEQLSIEWDTVRRVTLVHEFPEPGLPGKGKTAKGVVRAAEEEAELEAENGNVARGKKSGKSEKSGKSGKSASGKGSKGPKQPRPESGGNA